MPRKFLGQRIDRNKDFIRPSSLTVTSKDLDRLPVFVPSPCSSSIKLNESHDSVVTPLNNKSQHKKSLHKFSKRFGGTIRIKKRLSSVPELFLHDFKSRSEHVKEEHSPTPGSPEMYINSQPISSLTRRPKFPPLPELAETVEDVEETPVKELAQQKKAMDYLNVTNEPSNVTHNEDVDSDTFSFVSSVPQSNFPVIDTSASYLKEEKEDRQKFFESNPIIYNVQVSNNNLDFINSVSDNIENNVLNEIQKNITNNKSNSFLSINLTDTQILTKESIQKHLHRSHSLDDLHEEKRQSEILLEEILMAYGPETQSLNSLADGEIANNYMPSVKNEEISRVLEILVNKKQKCSVNKSQPSPANKNNADNSNNDFSFPAQKILSNFNGFSTPIKSQKNMNYSPRSDTFSIPSNASHFSKPSLPSANLEDLLSTPENSSSESDSGSFTNELSRVPSWESPVSEASFCTASEFPYPNSTIGRMMSLRKNKGIIAPVPLRKNSGVSSSNDNDRPIHITHPSINRKKSLNYRKSLVSPVNVNISPDHTYQKKLVQQIQIKPKVMYLDYDDESDKDEEDFNIIEQEQKKEEFGEQLYTIASVKEDPPSVRLDSKARFSSPIDNIELLNMNDNSSSVYSEI
ncbi:hypothetical protein TBLA_0B03630 [Henningerozyma blattae CBS 6284]|uniref:Uncharacterized protein n=1 Tax=Henningerozyma blattae (strain ATCC 34711 / CBS 6284 / DSM 70876 / NBRC 10599 / NRRL Y-10934 / UCD 77-7) TaxID=1071380 RepID=I2GYK0_HENB6|nr:hypothetical protein TBLA_0B03630 [Tetrapisispora blattae CBS 6284]CCH59202.1 hypothetical protein TBLA_0B03630 [Tetrapisispora blattae CBS 6284]